MLEPVSYEKMCADVKCPEFTALDLPEGKHVTHHVYVVLSQISSCFLVIICIWTDINEQLNSVGVSGFEVRKYSKANWVTTELTEQEVSHLPLSVIIPLSLYR